MAVIKGILVLIFLICSTNCIKNKCYVLALQGGGERGAYQAGAIKGLVDNLSSDEVNWDIITGVSIGSINAAGLSLYGPGEEKEASDRLVEIWKSINGYQDAYQNWPWGILEGVYYRSGLYDNSPLRTFLEKSRRNKLPKRKFSIGATNFETGKYETWDEITITTGEDLVEAIVSSSVLPGIFPLNKFKNNSYVDGGVKMSVDVSSGVNRCLDMGFEEDNVVVDIVLLTNEKDRSASADGVHPLTALYRVFEIFYRDMALQDLDLIRKIFPKVNFRYVVSPTKNLPDSFMPKFSPKDIEVMINYGIQDSIEVIKNGWGTNLEILLKEYKEEKLNLFGRKGKKITSDKDEKISTNLIFLS